MPSIVDDDDDLLTAEEVEDSKDVEVETEDAPEELAESSPPNKAESSDERTEDTEGEDEEGYSKRVQKRINKLTNKMRQFEQESRYWREKVESLEAKSQAKEFTDFQAQVEQSEAQIKTQIEAARAAKKTAIEEGDVEAQMRADDQLLELRDQLTEKRRLANAAKEQAAQFREPKREEASPPPPATPEIPDHLPEGTKQWLKANRWFIQGTDAKAADYARTLDASLQEEGYSPDDPEMYAELDRRLRVLVPRLAKTVKSTVTTAAKAPKPRVAGSSADGQRPASAGAKPARKLTSNDLTVMRKFGMDPNKPEHRRAWLHRNDPL